VSRILAIAGIERHLAGWRPSRPDHRDLIFGATEMREASAPPRPASTDLGSRCPPVFDQGGIGSCVANATSEAVEYLYRQPAGADGHAADPILSRLFLYAVARRLEGTPLGEDSGCEVRDAMRALRVFGVPTEEAWPYDTSKFAELPPQDAFTLAALHRAVTYYRIAAMPGASMIDKIRDALAEGYPVVGGFSVPSNMSSDHAASTGEVLFPAPLEGFSGGHSVLFVGHDDARALGPDAGALTFQNSWGSGWGDKGRGYLPYRFVTEGLAADFWTVRRVAGVG
jgi:C1A family cysteine protease